MTTKLHKGNGVNTWELYITDEDGLLLGVHFSIDRKIDNKKIAIVKAALVEAVKKINALKGEK